MPTSSKPCGSSIFDPRKIKLAKEHFKYFHPNSLGRFFTNPEERSFFHPPTHSYSLSSDPNFDLKAWQMAPEVYEDTLYLCPWCIMEEKKNQDRSTLQASKGSIWSPQVFLPTDNNYLWEGEAPGKSEDITIMDWDHRDSYGFDKLRRLATKGPDTKDLECITEADISDCELDPDEEAKIMEPLSRHRFPIFFDQQLEEEEEEEQFFDAVDDSPESGWESLEEHNSVQEEGEEDEDEEDEENENLFENLAMNNSQDEEVEDEFIDEEDDEVEEEDNGAEEEDNEAEEDEGEDGELPSFNSEDGVEEESFESEIDPIIESSMNIEEEDNAQQEPRPIYFSESERYHKEWLNCQNKIKDSKIKKYIDEKLKTILSVAFEECDFVVPKSNAEIFESIPNMNRDEIGDFELADASELQDLCVLSFAARKEKFLP